MERLEEIKKLLLIFMDILGEGFCELLELKPGTYRSQKSKILHTKDFEIIKEFLQTVETQIQKLAKTQLIIEDNEIHCRDTGADKLLVPFLFLDEYIHLLHIMVYQEIARSDTIEVVLNACLCCCDSQDNTFIKESYIIKKHFLNEKYMESICRNFRDEYYSVCRDVINNRKKGSSFFEWPIRNLTETIEIDDWCDGTVNERTIERMKTETGSRRWATIKDLISIEACDRFTNDQEKLKEYEIFQARLLMAYLLENFVNSKTLQKEYNKKYLYELLDKGLHYKS